MSEEATTPSPAPAFRLGQIFLVEAALGYRIDPITVPDNTGVKPQKISVAFEMRHINGGEATQVAVAVTTTPELNEPDALYDFHVKIAALIDQVDRTKWPDNLLAEAVATMIFPFVRETVANLTQRGRFGPVWINPFNVREALHTAIAERERQLEMRMEVGAAPPR
jgi:preprotein translocase subunit SecB